MKQLTAKLLLLAMATICSNHNSAYAQTEQPSNVKAEIHLDQRGEEIHPFVYGMFTELLHNMFENGVWAEMLSDRKFFYPVDNSSELQPRNTRNHQLRWRPIGPESAVTMDKMNPYVGKHSPKITLTNQPHGICQSGLWIQKGHGYDGRIVLKSDNGVKVNVSLVWGEGDGERSSVEFAPTNDYNTYSFHFDANADVHKARLEIVGSGYGSFHIGAVSLMPDDNIKGFRRDIVAILKDIGAPIYRWPGGNFLANYDWRYGIGDPDKRPPRYDYAWETVESNDVGTDEYLTWCSLIGCEPYIVVNAGLGDAYSAGEWVDYVNGDVSTPMGAWRAKNGHAAPYGVKYWGIGNEMYGEWQIGYMSAYHYSLKHNFIAEEMLLRDSTILLVASGATIYETSTTSRHHRKPLRYTLPISYMSQDDWDGMLLSRCIDNFDFLAEHIYTYFNGYFDKESQNWIAHRDNLTEKSYRTPNRIKGMVEAMKEYERLIPRVKAKQPKMWVDEWIGGDGHGFNYNLGVATSLNEFIRNSHYVMMGGHTGFSSMYRYNDVDAVISLCGLIFKLYIHHQRNIPLVVSGNSPHPHMAGTVGVDIPKEPCGSPTYPLDVIATTDGKFVALTVVNPTMEQQHLDVAFHGGPVAKAANVYSISSDNVDDDNSVNDPEKVKIMATKEKHFTGTISIPPHTIRLYEMELKR